MPSRHPLDEPHEADRRDRRREADLGDARPGEAPREQQSGNSSAMISAWPSSTPRLKRQQRGEQRPADVLGEAQRAREAEAVQQPEAEHDRRAGGATPRRGCSPPRRRRSTARSAARRPPRAPRTHPRTASASVTLWASVNAVATFSTPAKPLAPSSSATTNRTWSRPRRMCSVPSRRTAPPRTARRVRRRPARGGRRRTRSGLARRRARSRRGSCGRRRRRRPRRRRRRRSCSCRTRARAGVRQRQRRVGGPLATLRPVRVSVPSQAAPSSETRRRGRRYAASVGRAARSAAAGQRPSAHPARAPRARGLCQPLVLEEQLVADIRALLADLRVARRAARVAGAAPAGGDSQSPPSPSRRAPPTPHDALRRARSTAVCCSHDTSSQPASSRAGAIAARTALRSPLGAGARRTGRAPVGVTRDGLTAPVLVRRDQRNAAAAARVCRTG